MKKEKGDKLNGSNRKTHKNQLKDLLYVIL